MNASVISQLREIAGEDQVLTEKEDLIPYGFDGTAAIKEPAACVVLAKTTEQVSAIVKLAREEAIPVVTRGSGTGRMRPSSNR